MILEYIGKARIRYIYAETQKHTSLQQLSKITRNGNSWGGYTATQTVINFFGPNDQLKNQVEVPKSFEVEIFKQILQFYTDILMAMAI